MIITKYGSDGLSEILENFVNALEYALEMYARIEEHAEESLEILNDSIHNGPSDSACKKVRKCLLFVNISLVIPGPCPTNREYPVAHQKPQKISDKFK